MGKKHTGRSIASALGIREETVSGWKNDKNPPEEPRLSQLAEILEVSPQWLRYGAGEIGAALPDDPFSLGMVIGSAIGEARSSLKLLGEITASQERIVAQLSMLSKRGRQSISDLTADEAAPLLQGVETIMQVAKGAKGKARPPRSSRTATG